VLLKAAITKADEYGMPLSLALLDLDNFKRVNDTYGHQTGDEVLRKVAARMIGAVRGDDVICRLGGDEFLIVMTDTPAAAAARIVERVRSVVTETPLATRDGSIPMSVSAGCTMRTPHDPATAEALLERADQALLQSKAAGRNRVRMTS
jgi:two-component system cell cycle response regulator